MGSLYRILLQNTFRSVLNKNMIHITFSRYEEISHPYWIVVVFVCQTREGWLPNFRQKRHVQKATTLLVESMFCGGLLILNIRNCRL